METIKIVLLIGLVLFLLYVLMVLIREMKGVYSGTNTNTNTNTQYRRPNPNARRVHYYN